MFDPKRIIYYHHNEEPSSENTKIAIVDLINVDRGIILSAPEHIMPQLFTYGMTRTEVVETLRSSADEIEGRLIEQPRMDRHS